MNGCTHDTFRDKTNNNTYILRATTVLQLKMNKGGEQNELLVVLVCETAFLALS